MKHSIPLLLFILTSPLFVLAAPPPLPESSYRVYSQLPEPFSTSKGELIYRESSCAICHGEMGDGEGFLAEGLDPKPRDFTSFEEMKRVADLQMEDAIRLGVEATAMPAHTDLSDEQIRDLVFYLRSLLADTYMTINLCFTQEAVIDTEKEGFELKDFRLKVDNPDLISVKQKGKLIYINPNRNWDTLKFLLAKKVTRTHVRIFEKDKLVSLLAVRLHRCFN